MSNTSDQRIILVTGGNKGIGYEAVKQLAQTLPKATIILASRSLDNGRAAIKKMQESAPEHDFSNVKVVALDITSKASIDGAVQTVKSDFGKLDAVVHNSGISNIDGDGKTKAVFDVNVQGTRDAVEAFMPLLPANDGIVIVVSSTVGTQAMNALTPDLRARLDDPSKVTADEIDRLTNDWLLSAKEQPSSEDWSKLPIAYTVSKAFISAWCRAFALQNPQYKFAVVCPGFCATDLNHHRGIRPAAKGGESIVWPLFNSFESGHMYLDGKEIPFIAANGAVPNPPPIQLKK